MNDIVELPARISVKISKNVEGIFIADLPELNTHVEADNEFDLIRFINNAIKLYFDLPEKSPLFYAPKGLFERPIIHQPTALDFLKYLPQGLSSCYC